MDWNARYEEGSTPWDKGFATPVLEEIWARTELEDWKNGTVLVPGCGLGHDARWLAEKELEVFGLDVAPLAIEEGKKLAEGMSLRLELGDFFEPNEKVSVIFEHTCFCAIDPSERSRYVKAASEWLSPSGLLVAIFFMNPGSDGDGPPFGSSKVELDELFQENFQLLDEWVPEVAYEGREGRELVRILRRK